MGEVDRLSGVMDAQLSANTYLAGEEYSIADMATWPWAFLLGRMVDENVWQTFPHLKRWVDLVASRPAVQVGRKVGDQLGKKELSEEENKKRQNILFNQSNDKVRAAREEAARSA
jgi:GST-like protein